MSDFVDESFDFDEADFISTEDVSGETQDISVDSLEEENTENIETPTSEGTTVDVEASTTEAELPTSNEEVSEDEAETKEDSSGEDNTDFTGLAKFFADKGWIKEFNEEDFDGSWESLNALIDEGRNQDIESIIDEYKGTLQPITKRIEDMIEGGVPEEDIVSHFKDVKSLQNISKSELSENENLQEEFLKMYYKKTTSLSDNKIDKMVKLKVETGETDDLDEMYDEYNDMLVEEEKKMMQDVEAQEKAMEQEVNNTISEINKYIDDSKEIMGIKLSPKIKQDIKNQYQVVKDTNGNDVNPIMMQRAKNPVAFDFALRFLDAIGLLHIDEKTKQWVPDLSKLGRAAKSKATKEIAETFGNNRPIKTGSAITQSAKSLSAQENAKALMKQIDDLED